MGGDGKRDACCVDWFTDLRVHLILYVCVCVCIYSIVPGVRCKNCAKEKVGKVEKVK